jgi:peptidyl-prolyl cis-trans isomerase D
MLQTIREKAQGWIAWVIVIVITIPFAFFGIHEYLGYGEEPVKVSINDRDITESEFEKKYAQHREGLKAQRGDAFRPDAEQEAELRKQYLDTLIQKELVIQAADRIGLRVSPVLIDQLIQQESGFQVEGQFNRERFLKLLRRERLTEEGFKARLTEDILVQQMISGIGDTTLVADPELEARIRLELQQREFDYLLIPADDYLGTVVTEAAEVEDYYQAHQSEFMSPEQVKLEYVELDTKEIAKKLEVDEETLLGYYEQHKNDFVRHGRWRASHILISVADQQDAAAVEDARTRAEAALKRVQQGEDFAAVAKEVSEDPGSKSVGGDLGYFVRGDMVSAFEEAAFELAEGEISGLVQSELGFHIIQMNEARPFKEKTFQEARAQVRDDYLQNEAEKLFYDDKDKLGNIAWEQPDSLQPAAEALGLSVKESDWIGRDGGEGVLSSPGVAAAAFSDEVLANGNNSDPIELETLHVIVLRVVEHQEARVLPLETVSEQIVNKLQREKAAAKASAHGQGLIDKLQQGDTLPALAESESKELNKPGAVIRYSAAVPQPIRNSAFRLPRPAEEIPVYGSAVLDNGDFAIIVLHSVKDGTLAGLNPAEKQGLRRNMQTLVGGFYLQHFIDNERDAAEIVIPEEEEEE